MEEPSIEEKAKRYDEAIVKGRQIQNTPYTAHWDTMKEVVEHLFPELKESKDEVIRKALIELVRKHCVNETRCMMEEWLEKQGEQKEYPKEVIDNAVSFLTYRNDGMPEKEARDIVNSIISVIKPEYWPRYVNMQNPAWSEEDEVKRNALICLIEEIKNQPLKRLEDWDGYISWLKSLKSRVQPQPKSEWSEEDEMMLEGAIDKISDLGTGEMIKDWLKALKDKFIWKPSDEQMRAFYKYLNEGDKTLTLSESLLLRHLYNDLKKLK